MLDGLKIFPLLVVTHSSSVVTYILLFIQEFISKMAVPKWLIDCMRGKQRPINQNKSSKYFGVSAIPKRFNAQLCDPTTKKQASFGNYESEICAAMRVDEELSKQGRYDKMNCLRFPQDFPQVCCCSCCCFLNF